jgi:tripartite-type tricarboxylate transporter receptor subunit TctC
MAPAGTPKPIIDKLNEEINKVISKPEVQASWNKRGAVSMVKSPAEFEQFLRADIQKWARIVQISGLKPQ